MLEDKYPDGRTRAYRRNIDFSKSMRKFNLEKVIYFHIDEKEFEEKYRNELHRYSKAKIHCSCPICSAKTNNKGRKNFFQPNYNPDIAEIKSNMSMDSQYKEYIEED